MAVFYTIILTFLISLDIPVHCASAVHSHGHNLDGSEREGDGGYRPRDYEHYTDTGHNSEFDHEAILGSMKEAEEFDRLKPEEARRRLALLLPEMDLNADAHIDQQELKQWILKSFVKLSREEAEERMSEADFNSDGVVTWLEYLHDGFGVDSEEEVSPGDTGDTGMLLHQEKAMWKTADTNEDGKLNLDEFTGAVAWARVCCNLQVFINPEEHEAMHPYLLNQTLREKDANRDGLIDLDEYIGDRGAQQSDEWLLTEQDKFQHELDLNHDGVLDAGELHRWIIPDNDEIAAEEVDHLLEMADDDRDGRLSYDEVLAHQDVFVGSDATGYGQFLDHGYGDEL